MSSETPQAAGRAPAVEAVQVVALYEAETGRIVHQHVVCVLSGGRSVPEDEAVEAARRLAAQLGHTTDSLRVKVSTDPEHAEGIHRINLQTGELVRVTEPELRDREQPQTS
jgi:hypothetical protein